MDKTTGRAFRVMVVTTKDVHYIAEGRLKRYLNILLLINLPPLIFLMFLGLWIRSSLPIVAWIILVITAVWYVWFTITLLQFPKKTELAAKSLLLTTKYVSSDFWDGVK